MVEIHELHVGREHRVCREICSRALRREFTTRGTVVVIELTVHRGRIRCVSIRGAASVLSSATIPPRFSAAAPPRR